MKQLIVTANSLYKRNAIPASLPDSKTIVSIVKNGYQFEGTFIPSGTGQVPGDWYIDKDNCYYWARGVAALNPAPDITAADATILGLDVSGYQQDKAINWPEVKKSMSFVYIKVTEGVNTTDALCKAHALGASAAGFKMGYYHFAIVSKDAVEQANHFDSVMKSLPQASLPPALDVETNKADLTPAEMEAWIATFIATLNSLGYLSVMIYSYASFLNQNLPQNHSLGNNPLWLARYDKKLLSPPLPVGWESFDIWQYAENGTISGIIGEVDMNRAVAGGFI